MTEEDFQSHKEILNDLLKNKITTKTIKEYLGLLDDSYYMTKTVYPKWLTRCDTLRIEGTKDSFEIQLVVNLADELLTTIKEYKECSTEQILNEVSHIDSNLVRLSLSYLKDQRRIGISSSGMIQYILTLEDRKKILIDQITSGSKEMIYPLEDSLEQYKEQLDQEIPF